VERRARGNGPLASCTLVLLLAIVALSLRPFPAAADCAVLVDAGIEEWDTVFVGVATDVGVRTASFAVEEVWQGRDLAPSVRLVRRHGGSPWPLSLGDGLVSASSVDAAVDEGTTYLVGLYAPGATTISSCDVAELTAQLRERLAPPEVRAPVADGDGGVSVLQRTEVALPLVLATAVAAALALGVAVRRRAGGRGRAAA
jgi:hypothetical protein